jgi:hypothetical protein
MRSRRTPTSAITPAAPPLSNTSPTFTEAAPYGLAAATGTVGSVGMAGLTLGGGYGPTNGRFGLALDNLLGAEVVLADGRLVSVDASHEPELYWALRGGGGNFGVVTSMRIRLHRVHRLLAGFIIFPWSQAAEVWSGLGAVVAAAPDELTIQSGVLAGPDGRPTLFLSPTWSGDDLERGERAIDELRWLGTPAVSQVLHRAAWPVRRGICQRKPLRDSYPVRPRLDPGRRLSPR